MADTVGDVRKTRVQLPSGPAVQVRATKSENPDPTGHGTLLQAITFAIRPPGFEDAVVASVSSTVLHLGDKLAEMADAIVRTIHVARLR
jgi:hypothetical protein